MTFFSHRPGFSDFYSLFSSYLYCVKCRIWPFLHKKSHYFRKEFIFFYSVQAFAPIPQHCFSKYWGDQCMGRPPTSNFGGTVLPVPPRSPPLLKVNSWISWTTARTVVSLGISSYCIRDNDCSEKLNNTLKSLSLQLYLIPLICYVVFVSFSLWSEFKKTQHMLLITHWPLWSVWKFCYCQCPICQERSRGVGDL